MIDSLLDIVILLAILVGLVLGGSLLVSLIVVKELFMVFAGVLILFVTFELASALRFAGRDVPRVAAIIAGLAVVPAALVGPGVDPGPALWSLV